MNSQTVVCKLCTKNFKDNFELEIHLKEHLKKEFFKTNNDLTNHSKTHTFKDSLKADMSNDSDANQNSSDSSQTDNETESLLVASSSNKDNTDNMVKKKKYQCKYCSRFYSRQSILTIHLRKHTGERPYACSECPKTFYCNTQLISHSKSHSKSHSFERPYPCSLCDKSFKSKRALDIHVRIHFEERPFSCSLCNKSFKIERNLRAHVTIHNEDRPFACTMCSAKFKRKPCLERHKKTHEDKSPTQQKEFPCHICTKSFDKERNLKVHIRHHQKRVTCEYCSKAFHLEYHLKLHLRVHTGERPFVCEICNKAYTTKHRLQCHSRAHIPKDSITNNSLTESLDNDMETNDTTNLPNNKEHENNNHNFEVKHENEQLLLDNGSISDDNDTPNVLENINDKISIKNEIKIEKEELFDAFYANDSTYLVNSPDNQTFVIVNKSDSDIPDVEQKFVPESKEFINILEKSYNQMCVKKEEGFDTYAMETTQDYIN